MGDLFVSLILWFYNSWDFKIVRFLTIYFQIFFIFLLIFGFFLWRNWEIFTSDFAINHLSENIFSFEWWISFLSEKSWAELALDEKRSVFLYHKFNDLSLKLIIQNSEVFPQRETQYHRFYHSLSGKFPLVLNFFISLRPTFAFWNNSIFSYEAHFTTAQEFYAFKLTNFSVHLIPIFSLMRARALLMNFSNSDKFVFDYKTFKIFN